ncbi:MAG: hypothetical protein HFE67_08775 [Erysipelotrichaceae bacterium]|nr:hypothetical protein [Erysipelotrichaceae bacterium]
MKRVVMSGLSIGNQVLGSQSVSDTAFEHVNVLGELVAQNCQYKKLHILGTAQCENCDIHLANVKGTLTAHQCHMKELTVYGEGILSDCAVDSLWVLGRFMGNGTFATHVRVGTKAWMSKVHGHERKQLLADDLRGEVLENFIPLSLSNQRFGVIVNAGDMDSTKEVACRSYYGFYATRFQELNADFIYLNSRCRQEIKELHGSLVIIDPCFDEAWIKDINLSYPLRDYRNRTQKAQPHIGCIEADEVFLETGIVNIIRADRVTLGPKAQVAQVEYKEYCKAHAQASVGRMIKV